jgi:hypothetical protein
MTFLQLDFILFSFQLFVRADEWSVWELPDFAGYSKRISRHA